MKFNVRLVFCYKGKIWTQVRKVFHLFNGFRIGLRKEIKGRGDGKNHNDFNNKFSAQWNQSKPDQWRQQQKL